MATSSSKGLAMGNKESFVVFRWRYWIRGLQLIQLHVINSNWFNAHICIHIDAIHVMCLQEKFCWCVSRSYVTFKRYVDLLFIYVLCQGFRYVIMWYVKNTHVLKHLFTYMWNGKLCIYVCEAHHCKTHIQIDVKYIRVCVACVLYVVQMFACMLYV